MLPTHPPKGARHDDPQESQAAPRLPLRLCSRPPGGRIFQSPVRRLPNHPNHRGHYPALFGRDGFLRHPGPGHGRRDQETLLARYQEEGRSDLALRGYLAQRLAIFNGLPLTYASCQENTRRYASPTSYSGTYDLFFQVNGPLPASFQARIPDYTVQAIQATGTMTVTIQISKEDTPWSYFLFSVEDIAF